MVLTERDLSIIFYALRLSAPVWVDPSNGNMYYDISMHGQTLDEPEMFRTLLTVFAIPSYANRSDILNYEFFNWLYEVLPSRFEGAYRKENT